MLIFPASSYATTNSKASFNLPKAHSEVIIFFQKVSLNSSHVPFFKAVKPLHHWFVANRMMAALHLFKVLFGWRFLLPLTLHSFSSSTSSRNLFTLLLSRKKHYHIPRTHGSFPIIFHILPRYASLSTTCLHCTFVSCFSPYACKCLLKHHRHRLVVYASSPSSSTTDASCQLLRGFSLHRVSHRNNGFGGTLTAPGTKVLFPLPHLSPVFLRIPRESLFFWDLTSSPSLSVSLPLLESFASTCSRRLSPSRSTKVPSTASNTTLISGTDTSA